MLIETGIDLFFGLAAIIAFVTIVWALSKGADRVRAILAELAQLERDEKAAEIARRMETE